MKMTTRFLLFVLALASLVLSACGGAATATPNTGGGKPQQLMVAFTGVVESMAGDQWVINGTTLTVDPAVVRDGPFIAGDRVKVEGAVNPDGSFTVSRVESPTPEDLSTLAQFGDDSSNQNSNDANTNDANSNDDNSNDANVNDDNSNTANDNVANMNDDNSDDANSNDDNGNVSNSNDDNGAAGNSNDDTSNDDNSNDGANSNDDNSSEDGNDNGGSDNDSGGGNDNGGNGNGG